LKNFNYREQQYNILFSYVHNNLIANSGDMLLRSQYYLTLVASRSNNSAEINSVD